MGPKSHHLNVAFHDDYPRELVVCCSDGRYVEAVGEFLARQGIARHDLIGCPGGPAAFCPRVASVYEYRVHEAAFDFLVRSHQTRRVLLIAHLQCGYYLQRFGQALPDQQRDDLRQVRERILDRHPALAVELYFARPAGDGEAVGMVLDEVPAAASG
jgi:hypothetical protein